MSSFETLQYDTMDLCQELQKETDFTLDKVKRAINRGYYDFVKRTLCIQDYVDITTVADQASYTSSDSANLAFVYKVHEVRFDVSATERGDKLFPYPGGHDALPDIIHSGTPTHYWTRGLNTRAEFEIGLHPVDSTGSLTLRVYAFMFPTADLTLDANEPLMKEAWQDALVNYAVWKLFSVYSHKNRDYRNKSLEYKAYYMEDVDMANETMLTENIDGFPRIQDAYP